MELSNNQEMRLKEEKKWAMFSSYQRKHSYRSYALTYINI